LKLISGKSILIPYRHLIYTLAVAEHGSVQAASNRIAISQPALSAAIQKVEQNYGLKIFLRSRPNKLILTPDGKRFIARAKVLVEGAEEFEDNIRNLSNTLNGTIQLGCFTPTAAFIIPLILSALKDRDLDITVEVHEADLGELNTMLSQGSIDLALAYNMSPSPSIEFETLIEAQPYVLLSKNDALASKQAISLTELVGREMVSLSLPITQQFFLSLFSKYNLRPKVRYETKSYELARSLVAAGEGYGIFIMRPLFERAYNGNELVYLPLVEDVPSAHYGIAMTSRAIPTKLIDTFTTVCRETLGENRAADQFFIKP
jgi:DNA-binding transcriptional LysR family regulator